MHVADKCPLTGVTRVVLLTSGCGGHSEEAEVMRHLGPEDYSMGLTSLEKKATIDDSPIMVVGVGAVTEPVSEPAV